MDAAERKKRREAWSARVFRGANATAEMKGEARAEWARISATERLAPMANLDRFLAQECTPQVAEMLRKAVEAAASGAAPRRNRFEFNLFEITFDLDTGDAVIEDVLDATTAGSQRVRIEDLVAALSGR